ncbi:GntP family permease [Hydrogenophaga sp.]|jgi:H+/gluconate symporter-like permease|uniref:GntP family permease n=1 Tax=Hydrogenophaga sp. TaxID=1904254 RepID=UPI0027306666|nr:GntP family permease [Hydrogenophaga sp.]MDP1686222.1 GntP family permease [Hydrogenophaga sp.]
MTSIAGIVLALVLLMALAWRGVSVLLLAPLMALLAVLFSPDTPLLASYTQVFMKALGGFVVAFFPLFLLGAVFGKLMEDSGAARVIAHGIVRWLGSSRAVLAIVLACAVLTYGGVSLFVVAFAVYPIAAALFRQAALPKRLIPGTIALGAFTFTMTALPGTPAIQNAIPMPYFGTTPFAAPGLGLIGGAVMLVLGVLWLTRRAASARSRGEGYGDSDEEPAPAAPTGFSGALFARAIAPVVLVIALNYLLATWWLPALDTRYLAQAAYGATSIDAVRGIWAVIVALAAATVLLVLLQRQALTGLAKTLDQGASSSVLPLLNTASQVGFGAVIASLAGFALLRDAVLAIAPGNPLVSMSIAVNILAGITGSASGGMSIALQTLGENWLAMGQAAGISPELLHRVTAIATGGLDALPHNGAVITLLSICGLTHRQSYLDILVVAVVFPLVALAVVVTLGTALGSF